MTEDLTAYTAPPWVPPHDQATIDRQLDALGMPECARCGAITHLAGEPCVPCDTPGQQRAYWYQGSPRVRPRAAVFTDAPQTAQDGQDGASPADSDAQPLGVAFWQAQAERYAIDLATLNARLVRLQGLVQASIPYLPEPLRRQAEQAVEAKGR